MTGRPCQTRPPAKETEREENIWRRKIFVFLRKGRKIFGDGRYIFRGGEEKWRRRRRKIFVKGKYFFAEEKKNREGLDLRTTVLISGRQRKL